jgi:hypothetical protein
MDRRILVNGGIPIAELVDRPEACLPKLEEILPTGRQAAPPLVFRC